MPHDVGGRGTRRGGVVDFGSDSDVEGSFPDGVKHSFRCILSLSGVGGNGESNVTGHSPNSSRCLICNNSEAVGDVVGGTGW